MVSATTGRLFGLTMSGADADDDGFVNKRRIYEEQVAAAWPNGLKWTKVVSAVGKASSDEVAIRATAKNRAKLCSQAGTSFPVVALFVCWIANIFCPNIFSDAVMVCGVIKDFMVKYAPPHKQKELFGIQKGAGQRGYKAFWTGGVAFAL